MAASLVQPEASHLAAGGTALHRLTKIQCSSGSDSDEGLDRYRAWRGTLVRDEHAACNRVVAA